jgi:hypothetical protein
MSDDLIRQLNLRIEEQQHYLCERLDLLQESIQAIHTALAERLDAHEAYHRANEHRWGLIRLAQRHPFRLALLAAILAGAGAVALPESLGWWGAALKHLVARLF